MVTEFCNEGDLRSLLNKKGKITEKETMKYLKDIICGYVEFARKGFLHRDLKLANIFIRDKKAKIGDFGFAKKQEA